MIHIRSTWLIYLWTITSSCAVFGSDSTCQTESTSFVHKNQANGEAWCDGFNLFLLELFSKEFGYTLTGTKPVSHMEIPRKRMDEARENYLIRLKNIFNGSPNFALKILDKGPPYSVGLTLVHKKALRQLIRANFRVHSFVRREFASKARFQDEIETSLRGIAQIAPDERIIGYLFGYSPSNVEYYMRRMEVGRYLQKYPLFLFHPLPGARFPGKFFVPRNLSLYYKHIKPCKGFKSLEDEWKWIEAVAWDVWAEANPSPPYFVSLPLYVCRHGGDSEASRQRFREASYRIAELLSKKSPQEAISEIAQDCR